MNDTQNNRDKFLAALRSGEYLKGPIDTDSKGRPIDHNATGYCAVGLAYTLFGGTKEYRQALGLTNQQFTKIQQEWNDSPLTFLEIADLIELEMFHVNV